MSPRRTRTDDERLVERACARTGLTSYALAPLLGISRTHLYAVARGERPLGAPERTLLRLLSAGTITASALTP